MTTVSDYYLKRRTEVAALLPATYRRVLELGCGAGEFRSNFELPCEYWGIEPSPEAGAVAATRLDRVLPGRFADAAPHLPADYFDLVICNDVLEHLEEPDRFLRDVRQHLVPGAVLVGSIPNVRCIANLFELLVKKDWEYKDEGTLDRTHLRFFTERSLRRFLTADGRTIETMVGINPAVTSPPSAKFLVKRLFIRLCGADTRFAQFAFRVRFGIAPRPDRGRRPGSRPRGVRRPMNSTRRNGQLGERVAALLLTSRGYTVLAHNQRVGRREIDLLAERGRLLVAVEVKWRRAGSGDVARAWSRDQRRRAHEAVLALMATVPGGSERPWRFDLVTIEESAHGWAVRHHPGAWSPAGSFW